MKLLKKTAAVLAAVLICATVFSSCKSKSPENDETHSPTTIEITTVSAVENADEISSYVVYFSLGDENDGIKKAAGTIAGMTGAQLFEITTPLDHTDGLDALRREIEQNVHPVINGRIENLSSAGAIFIGFPSVDGKLPMEIVSFMEEYDLRDAVLLPFTEGTDGDFGEITQKIDSVSFGSSQSVILDLGESENTRELISEWLSSLGFNLNENTTAQGE